MHLYATLYSKNIYYETLQTPPRKYHVEVMTELLHVVAIVVVLGQDPAVRQQNGVVHVVRVTKTWKRSSAPGWKIQASHYVVSMYIYIHMYV